MTTAVSSSTAGVGTGNLDVSTYDINVFPYLAPRTTESRLRHFTFNVYNTDPTSLIYRFVDALCGDAGAGTLKKELLYARFTQQLDSIFFRDLDNIFGKVFGLIRYASESYSYDPVNQMLTSEQWDEIKVKDAWYRQRVKDFFYALGLGGTPAGFRMMCRAALGVDAEIYEVSRYIDLGQGTTMQTFGRTGISLRNEVIVRPLKAVLTPVEKYVLTHLLERLKPREVVVTVDVNGLAIHTPITIQRVAASSSYFQVEKEVTGVPDLANLPPPEVLAADLDPSNFWVRANITKQAPTAPFTATQEASLYYLNSATGSGAIDSITYSSEKGGVVRKEINYVQYTGVVQFGSWTPWDKADSPDNYPGGKFGRTPMSTPALTTPGNVYKFPFKSQAEYIQQQIQVVKNQNGEGNDLGYRLPLVKSNTTNKRTWEPVQALPTSLPTKESTVVTPWVRRPEDLAKYISELSKTLYAGS